MKRGNPALILPLALPFSSQFLLLPFHSAIPLPFPPNFVPITPQSSQLPPNSSFSIPFLLMPLPSHNISDPLRTTSSYHRLSQLAELSHSKYDRELFISVSAYVKFFVTFATKVPYITFCDKMRQFLI